MKLWPWRRYLALVTITLLAFGAPVYAQQGFEPRLENRAGPQSQPSSPTLEVPQTMLGCWTGTPVMTQVSSGSGHWDVSADHLCFNPQPKFDYTAPSAVQVVSNETSVTASGPDWIQFENRQSNTWHGTGEVRFQHDSFHCRVISQSQIVCQGQVTVTDGVIAASGTWTETLNRESEPAR
jgi:hypothetical protein